MRVELCTGRELFERLGTGLDELHAATDVPVTARRPWLAAWARSDPQHEPLALCVRNGRGPAGRLEAAALLARRRRRGLWELVALGHGPSDHARLAARTEAAADALALALAEHLAGIDGPWRLVLRHLPEADPVALRLARLLANAALVEGDPSPGLVFGRERALRGYVSAHHHQQVRRMHNRLRREGHAAVIEHLRDADALRAVLPELEQLCRQRDLELRGRSVLDRPGMAAFFPRVIAEHAERGEVELTTVRVSGELAAYTLCFLDRGFYRMWSCRVSPAWTRYGVGRIGNDAAVRHALEDPLCRGFDWMLGLEPYKFSMSNRVTPSADLLAWSSAPVRVVCDLPRNLRRRAKLAAERHAWLQPAVRAVRRAEAAAARSLTAWRASRFGPESDALRVEPAAGAAAIGALAEEWEQLAQRVHAPPFARPGWIQAWWNAFGEGRPVVLCVRSRREGRLHAVLPLEERRGALCSTTNWHSNEFRLLADRRDAEELLLAHVLAERPRRLSLAFLEEQQAERVQAAAAAQGYRVIRRTQQSSPTLAIEGDWEAYERTLGRKLKSELRRRRRALEERGRLELRVTCTERLDELLMDGYRVEASGWKRSRGTAILSRPDTRRFYTDMARWAAERGWLRLAFLRLDGRPLAFHLCLELEGRHYLLKTGYDPAFAELGPGKLLGREMLERAFRLGLASYEFLGAADPAKLEWTSTLRERWLVQAFRPSPLGVLDWSAFAYARPLAKRVRGLVRA